MTSKNVVNDTAIEIGHTIFFKIVFLTSFYRFIVGNLHLCRL